MGMGPHHQHVCAGALKWYKNSVSVSLLCLPCTFCQRIYVTLFPCNECAKLIIQAGIREVIFHEVGMDGTWHQTASS